MKHGEFLGAFLASACSLLAACSDSVTDLPDGAVADGGACTPACGTGRLCCNGTCINPDNDPRHCGACGTTCTGATPFCDGTCKATPCETDGGTCPRGTCCGTACCTAGQLCCKDEGPITGQPQCFTPTASDPTCPQGCAPMCISDRAAKRDIVPVDPGAILQKVIELPVSKWSYRADRTGAEHIGPMAQDFYAAFGLGSTDRAYDPVDAHGVAFASIQALHEMVQAQGARIERLEAENRALRAGLRAR
ncbi:MAG: tail fiber domain-containing protein [Deltaproteobacteria bacterium]|nr:tail fiber domain-containing protein [Deltaproteobacteria bacterium]